MKEGYKYSWSELVTVKQPGPYLEIDVTNILNNRSYPVKPLTFLTIIY